MYVAVCDTVLVLALVFATAVIVCWLFDVCGGAEAAVFALTAPAKGILAVENLAMSFG